MTLEEIITAFVDAMEELSPLLEDVRNAADMYALLSEMEGRIAKLKDESKDAAVAYIADTGDKSVKTPAGTLSYRKASRRTVRGAALAERIADDMDRLNVDMLLDVIRAASSIKTDILSSSYIKKMAAEVEEVSEYDYLSLRRA